MSAIDDLIAFARGLIPPGVTDSEEARRLEALSAAAREAISGRSVAYGASLVMDKAKQVAADIISQHTMLLREAVAETQRVRRGARCLRERCRRLESRARGAEERAGIEHTAALYAWRMLFSADYPPFGRGAMLDVLHRRVASDYGPEFAAAGKGARAMADVRGMWPKEEA